MESTVIPIGYAEHDPPPDLAGYVVCFWTALEPSSPDAAPRRVLPDGCVDIIFEFGPNGGLTDAFVVGAMTKPIVINGPAPHLYIAVRFRPGFAFAAFGIPASELTDERLGFEFVSRDGGRELAHLATQPSNEARLAATVELVRRRLFGAHGSPVVPRSVRAAVQRIVGA
ncbi:MAG: DUF6597 domain-containing transcriptional factor, partial [bacterium]